MKIAMLFVVVVGCGSVGPEPAPLDGGLGSADVDAASPPDASVTVAIPEHGDASGSFGD